MRDRTGSTPRNTTVYVLIAATFLASTTVAGLIAHRLDSTSAPSTTAGSSMDERYDQLMGRLDMIELRLARLESPEPKFTPLGENAEEPAAGDQIDELLQRVVRLETLAQDRLDDIREREERAERFHAQRRARMENAARVAAGLILDPSASERQKADAWGAMRQNAADVWTDEIVAEAARIGTTSDDPQIRADIWRQAHAGHTHELLAQPLLQALRDDQHRAVREEAAETLDLYLDWPGVREALQTASRYDDDPGVRIQAATSLGGPQSGF